MFNFSNKRVERHISEAEKDVFFASHISGVEQKDIERLFARLFSTEDGKMVLAYLQTITFQRALGMGAPDEQLRYMEGQRSMIATILRLIDRGRRG